jgi:hypothetical protein
MPNGNEKFRDLVSRLELSPDGALSLNDLPMVLMPRHFFRYILREVHKHVSPEAFRKIYFQAGYDGAVSFCQAFQKSHQCSAREAVEGYLGEMSIRGWGSFSIQRLDAEKGEMEVLLENSSLQSDADIPSGNLAWEGAMLGSVAFVQKQLTGPYRPGAKVVGREVTVAPEKTTFHITVTPE